MSGTLSRLLLLVHGQPDSMTTPLPGFWGRSGGARVDTVTRYYRTHCSGCKQGCDLCDVELACDIHPDADRVIRAPIRTRSEEEQYLWWKRWAKLVAMAAIAALVGLLRLFGSTSLTAP